MQRNQGFSLIELIRVITILAVLIAVAVPRYLEMRSEARFAALLSAMATIKQAASQVRLLAGLQGQTGATGQVSLTDGTVVSVVYGWPAATAAGIGAALRTNLGASAFVQASNGRPRYELFIINKPYATNRCYLAYDQPTSAGGEPSYINFATDNPLSTKGDAGAPQCAD